METGKNFYNTSREEVKVTKWAFDKIKEAFEQVAKDEARMLSIVQEIMREAQITCDASPRQQVGKEALRCHTCALKREDAHELVVCDLRRKVRLKATKQALGGAHRRKC